MRVKYVGSSGRRIIGEYEWNAENGFVQDVTDEKLLENLRTYPRPDWQFLADEVDRPVVTDQPVTGIAGIGPARAAELAELGVATVEQLAAADTEHLAANTGASRKEIEKWVAEARSEVSDG